MWAKPKPVLVGDSTSCAITIGLLSIRDFLHLARGFREAMNDAKGGATIE